MKSELKKIIITGSEGSIGQIVYQGLKDDFEFVSIDQNGRGAVKQIDIAHNINSFEHATQGSSAIIHLAWDMSDDFPRELVVPENKTMAENVYTVAIKAKVPRVIMASSVHAEDYSHDDGKELIYPARNTGPDSPYGASKLYIENLGRYFANKHGLEVICLRLGGVNDMDKPLYEEDLLYDKVLLYKKDLLDLIRMCLDIKKVPDNFAVMYAVSNNPGRLHSLENPIGWKPKLP